MTTTDVIYLVKEMAICSYVVIIHSPHLCSLPGFRTPQVDVDPAGIRCRQVVSDDDFEGWAGRAERGEGMRLGTEQLRLPWARQNVEQKLSGQQEDQKGIVWSEDGKAVLMAEGIADLEGGLNSLNREAFLELLDNALEAISGQGGPPIEESDLGNPAEGEEEVILLSLIEDGDGDMSLDADVFEGEGTRKLGKEETSKLLEVVKEFMDQKTAEGKGQTKRKKRKVLKDEL